MTYYSVHIPPKMDEAFGDGEDYVFTDFEKALKVLKKFKEARLKTFSNSDEALKFSQVGFEICPSKSNDLKSPSASAAAAEKAAFRAPTKQELIQFRKAIEEDKFDVVEKTIWDNPRYLVNLGDTPTSLKDGTRYNALHVCAIHKRPQIAELILQTISKVYFIERLHGKKNEKVCQEVCDILLDYYLNMPEKGRSETPLHLAVKFGAVEVVEVLTSYPQCKMTPNLDNMLPKDIICNRMDKVDNELKEKIAGLLDERFYVPVIRSVDNSLPPTIGEPFSITNPPELNRDPMSPEREIQAYAGPMNKEQAQSFRRRWKTPPRVVNPNSSTVNGPYVSPLKNRCSSTPRQLPTISNNNTTPLKRSTSESMFPYRLLNLDLEDSTNGNYENKKKQESEEFSNNNGGHPKPMPFMLNTPLRRQKKDLFLTYREQAPSPLYLDDANISTPGSNNSARIIENDLLSDSPLKVRHMKLSDTEKGLELIGRELAKDQQIDWKEFWDFLGCFVDISSTEGLIKLESYLKTRKEVEEMQKNRSEQKKKADSIMDGLCSAFNNVNFHKNRENKPNTELNTNRNSEMPKSSSNSAPSGSSSQATTPYLCVEKSLQVFAKRMTKTIVHNLESVVSINDAFNSELKRLKSLVCSFKDDVRFLDINFNLVHSRFANLIVAYLKSADNVDSSAINKIQTCFKQIIQARHRLASEKILKSQQDRKEQLQCVSESILEYLNITADKILPENMKTEQICLDVWQKEKACCCHWESDFNRQQNRKKRLELVDASKRMDVEDHVDNAVENQPNDYDNDVWENIEDSSNENSDAEEDEVFWSDAGSEKSENNFYTPPESPSMLEMDIEDDLFETYNIYLLGEEPTKRDLDVINALFNTEINRDLYPNIHRWRAACLRHSLDERDNFPSPSIVSKRRVDSYQPIDRFSLARRLFSSPCRSSSTPSNLSNGSASSRSGHFGNYRQNSIDSNGSLNESSPLSRANLSLSFMNVSDI